MLSGEDRGEADEPFQAPNSNLAVDIPAESQHLVESSKNTSTQQSNSPESPASPEADREPRLLSPDLHNNFSPAQGQDINLSWSASSDNQLGSPGSTSDRVFPIRSVVSVDSTQTPYLLTARNSADGHDYFPPGVVAQSFSGPDIAGGPLKHRHTQPLSDDGKPTPRTRNQDSRLSNGRSRADRKASTSTTHGETDRYGGGGRMHLFDTASEKSNERADSVSISGGETLPSRISSSLGSRTPADQDNYPELMTARFKHIVTTEGHAIITGRDGETLQRCEDEP
jgi:hypothetical protein